MKKRSLFKKIIVPAIIIALASCGKEEMPTPNSREMAFSSPGEVLKEVQVSQIVSNGHVYDFYYGSDGKPEKVSGYYQSEVNEDGTSYELTEEYDLVYAGDRLNEVTKEFTYNRNLADGTQDPESGTTRVVYIYNDNGLVGDVQKTFIYELPDNSTGETTFSHLYEYNSDNKVVKISYNSPGQKSSSFYTLEWSGDNLAKQTVFYEQEGEGQRKMSGQESGIPGSSGYLWMQTTPEVAAMEMATTEVAALLDTEVIYSDYDDKINPMMLLGVLYGESQGMTRTKNNAGKIINISADEKGGLTESHVTNITHTYDSKGRPVRYKVSSTSHEPDATYLSEITITYRD